MIKRIKTQVPLFALRATKTMDTQQLTEPNIIYDLHNFRA